MPASGSSSLAPRPASPRTRSPSSPTSEMGKLMEKEKAARPRRAKSFDNVMSQYLSSLRRYPLLEHSEVVELFQVLEDDVAGAGAKKRAREKLIQSNLRL